MNLDGKTFRTVSNSPNGEVDGSTTFHYRQAGSVVTATYAGGRIANGHILGLMLPNGELEIRYHHLNGDGELMVGRARSVPTPLPDGRLRLLERWQWLSGDGSTGESVIEEI